LVGAALGLLPARALDEGLADGRGGHGAASMGRRVRISLISQRNGKTSRGSIRAISLEGSRSLVTTAGSSWKVAVSVGLKRPKWTWQPVAFPVAPS
jgi:hypothetical protein